MKTPNMNSLSSSLKIKEQNDSNQHQSASVQIG